MGVANLLTYTIDLTGDNMKANVLYDIGDIRFTEVPDPVPRRGEVIVRVSCAGICGSDIPRIYQTGAHVMPLINFPVLLKRLEMVLMISGWESALVFSH